MLIVEDWNYLATHKSALIFIKHETLKTPSGDNRVKSFERKIQNWYISSYRILFAVKFFAQLISIQCLNFINTVKRFVVDLKVPK